MKDGASIVTRSPVVEGRCAVCGEELGAGPWWVTAYPAGAHERCIDWTTRPFPYQRHLDELLRLHRRVGGEAAVAVAAAGRQLRALERAWPAGGVGAVREARAIIRGVKARLGELRVDPKVIVRL